MKYSFAILLSVVCFKIQAQSLVFQTLEKNLKSYYLMSDERYNELTGIIKKLEQDPDAVDQVTIEVYKKKQLDSALVNKSIRLMTENGSWSDINYKDDRRSGWDPKTHADRILDLTVVYFNPQSGYYQDKRLKNVLHKAMQFWFDAKLVCPNWWYNEIGVPKTLGPAFIFLRSELSEKELAGAVEVLNKSSFKQTGQNKVWQAGNVLFKAILLRDEQLAQRARDTIFSELRITLQEGIQPDYSFHQHGPQQQFGNYGLSFVTSMSFWSRVFSETPMALDKERLSILRNLILNGFTWVSWKGYFDINCLGRQFFKGSQKSKSLALAYSMIDMTYVDPEFKNAYMMFIADNYVTKKVSELNGTRHFWRSDMTIHRSSAWSSSVKMSSNRIQATEALNSENLLGYHLGSGTAFVYVDGREYDEIFPYWNWKKLPGVTNYQSDKPLPVLDSKGFRNKGDFTGGVSNGLNGITAFKLNRDSLFANKSWFYLDDQLICLGSDIHGDTGYPVYSTINQSRLKGEVFYNDSEVKQLPEGKTLSSDKLKWVYHDKIGYYYLNQAHTNVLSQQQSGSWEDIAFVYKGDEVIKKPVFTLEIEHGVHPRDSKYAYVILPGISLEEMKGFKPDFDLIRNTESSQVISKKDRSCTLMTVYEPTEVNISKIPSIKINTPGMYILEKSGNGWKMYVSDPTQKLVSVGIEFGGKTFSIPLPQDGDKGKTTSLKLRD